MHFALKQSCPDIEVVSAFDINTVANDVYQHNHGKRPYQVSIAPTVPFCRSLHVTAEWHNTSK